MEYSCFEIKYDGTGGRLKTIDPSDLSVSGTVTLDTNKVAYVSQKNFGIVGDYLYTLSNAYAPRYLHKFNKTTGAWIADIEITNVDFNTNSTCALGNYTDELLTIGPNPTYSGSTWGGYMCLYDVTYFSGTFYLPGNSYRQPFQPPLKLSNDKFAMTQTNYYSTGGSYVSLCTDLKFLTTINNLSTPVTKTDSETMKVTYEISW